MWRPGKRQVRQIALAMLLPALMFRAAIPAGYMPVASSGQPTLVMCSGVDGAAAQDAPGTPDPADSRHSNLPCHFATSAAAPPVDHAAAVVFDSAAPLASPGDAVENILPAIVRAQSARAPPISPYT